jgi:hypothetical protein
MVIDQNAFEEQNNDDLSGIITDQIADPPSSKTKKGPSQMVSIVQMDSDHDSNKYAPLSEKSNRLPQKRYILKKTPKRDADGALDLPGVEGDVV